MEKTCAGKREHAPGTKPRTFLSESVVPHQHQQTGGLLLLRRAGWEPAVGPNTLQPGWRSQLCDLAGLIRAGGFKRRWTGQMVVMEATRRFSHAAFITSNVNVWATCPTCVFSGGPPSSPGTALVEPRGLGTSPPPPTRSPNVLTEKVLMVPASSPSQTNLALRLVSRSSSSRGGFTNTTYGMNSSEYTRFSFCRGGGGGRRRKGEEEEAP